MGILTKALPESGLWWAFIMILCMTGTGPYSFERVTSVLDSLALKNGWDVFIQLGHSEFIPQNCRHDKFMGRDKLLQLIMECDLVVTHGGFGSIRDSLVMNKPVIAVPRKPELNEVQDDHQEVMVKELEKSGYIMAVYDVNNLESAIKSASYFKPKHFQNSSIPSIIKDYMYSQP